MLNNTLKMELYRRDQVKLDGLNIEHMPEIVPADPDVVTDGLGKIAAGHDASIFAMRHFEHQQLEFQIQSSTITNPEWHPIHHLSSDWARTITALIAQNRTVAGDRSLPALPDTKSKGKEVAIRE